MIVRSAHKKVCRACNKDKKNLFDLRPDPEDADQTTLEGCCAPCIDGHLSGDRPLQPRPEPKTQIIGKAEPLQDKWALSLGLDEDPGVECYHDPAKISARFGRLDCVKRVGEEDKSEIDYGSLLV